MQTEITVQVLQPKEEVFALLQKQGFCITETFTMKDWYFCKKSFKQIARMKYNTLLKQSILVRYVCGAKEKQYMMYKDKVYNAKGDCVQEQKIKTEIASSASAVEVLQKAQISLWAEVENHSTVFEKGLFSLAVQEIKDLGVFIELEEDETMKNASVNEKLRLLQQKIQSLGLNLGDDYFCKKPYMLLHKKAR